MEASHAELGKDVWHAVGNALTWCRGEDGIDPGEYSLGSVNI